MKIGRPLWTLALLLTAAGAAGAQQPAPIYRPIHEVERWVTQTLPSPDGRWILYRAFLWMPRKIEWFLFDRESGSVRSVGFLGSDARWSPSGDRIVFRRTEGIPAPPHVFTRSFDRVTGTLAEVPKRVSISPGVEPHFSPDGRWVAFVQLPATLGRLVAVPSTGGRERTVVQVGRPIVSPRWSPDGRWIYYSHADPGDGPATFRVPASGGTPEAVDGGPVVGFSADGRFRAEFTQAHELSTLTVREAESGREVLRARLPWGVVPQAWAPDRLVLLASEGVAPRAIQAISLQTGEVRTLSPEWGRDHRPEYSPDGRRILFQTVVGDSSRLAVMNADGSGRRLLVTLFEPSGTARWSPDGRHVAYMASQGPFRVTMVIDPETGVEREAARTENAYYDQIHWHRDGKALLVGIRDASGEGRLWDVYLDGRRRLLGPGTAASVVNADWTVEFSGEDVILHSLRGAPSRTVFSGPTDAGIDGNGVSPDGRFVALRVDPAPWFTAIIPVEGGPIRTVRTGLEYCTGGGYHVVWHPDGRHLVAGGFVGTGDCADQRIRHHLVPLNGEPFTDITAKWPGIDSMGDSLSPDGSTLILATERVWWGRILEIDLTSLLDPRAGR